MMKVAMTTLRMKILKMKKWQHLQMLKKENWYVLRMNRNVMPIRQTASAQVVSISVDSKKMKAIPTVRIATPRVES